MEAEGSLSCSQEPSTCPHHEPAQSSSSSFMRFVDAF
jgi:hypothetical protein